jgi:hypothetical protein
MKPSPPPEEWALYASHRARLTDAIVRSAQCAAGRLCVLGAGSCNDLALDQLADTFSEIHLVDIDSNAVARAIARQSASVIARLARHAPLDLSGVTSRRMNKWKRFPPSPADLEACAVDGRNAILAQLPGPFDVVVSACILTQMCFTAGKLIGTSHPLLDPLRLCLTRIHLGTLVGLTAGGGASLFACDLASSSTYPLADLSPDRDLFAVMDDIVQKGASYRSAHPGLIQSILRQVAEPELLDPWLWTGTLGRTYFVYAMRLVQPGY